MEKNLAFEEHYKRSQNKYNPGEWQRRKQSYITPPMVEGILLPGISHGVSKVDMEKMPPLTFCKKVEIEMSKAGLTHNAVEKFKKNLTNTKELQIINEAIRNIRHTIWEQNYHGNCTLVKITRSYDNLPGPKDPKRPDQSIERYLPRLDRDIQKLIGLMCAYLEKIPLEKTINIYVAELANRPLPPTPKRRPMASPGSKKCCRRNIYPYFLDITMEAATQGLTICPDPDPKKFTFKGVRITIKYQTQTCDGPNKRPKPTFDWDRPNTQELMAITPIAQNSPQEGSATTINNTIIPAHIQVPRKNLIQDQTQLAPVAPMLTNNINSINHYQGPTREPTKFNISTGNHNLATNSTIHQTQYKASNSGFTRAAKNDANIKNTISTVYYKFPPVEVLQKHRRKDINKYADKFLCVNCNTIMTKSGQFIKHKNMNRQCKRVCGKWAKLKSYAGANSLLYGDRKKRPKTT